jgi:hypothetical protein
MIFRNGSHPDAGYQGFLMRQIDFARTGIGDCQGDSTAGGQDISCGIGSPGGVFAGDSRLLLVKADISALPDNAVVYDAFLVLTLEEDSTGTTIDGSIEVSRMMRDWDTAANYYWPTASTTWRTAGTFALDTTGSWNNVMGVAAVDATSIRGAVMDYRLPAQWLGQHLSVPMDTLLTPSTAPNTLLSSVYRIKVISLEQATALTSFRVDLTREVRGWHSGQWNNYGVVLHSETTQSITDFSVSTQYSDNGPLADPYLVVRYLYAVPGGGGRGSGTIGPQLGGYK